MRRKAGKNKKMDQENVGQTRDETVAVSPEVAVIADAIHDLADAIRCLAQAQMPEAEQTTLTSNTLD